MDEEKLEKDPWLTLSTVTTFDTGEETRRIGEIYHVDAAKTDRVPLANILLNELFIDLLCNILEPDPARKKAFHKAICTILHEMKIIDFFKLKELSVVRNQCREELLRLLKLTQLSLGNDNSLQISRCSEASWARYNREFDETGFIADGGFGKVYKAVNRLDGIEYAIKKIFIQSDNFNQSQFDEVKCLAKLNHTNIVPYKSAWIEEISPLLYTPRLQFPTYDSDSSMKSSTLSIEEKTDSNSISFRDDSDENECCKKTVDAKNEKSLRSSKSKSGNNQLCRYNSSLYLKPAVLYIQMALCEKTLRRWMDERVEPTPMSTIRPITTQILEGISYIHSSNIVHHDIKPSNIFISLSGGLKIQLGDFGLSCALRKDNHRAVQGTRMYAAPEQLKGECNPKSDLYSLGIVLLELLVPSRTVMELSLLIDCLKANRVPMDLAAEYPEWIKTLAELVQDNPALRPSANQLLELLRKDKDLLIAKLKDDNEKQSILIKSLQDKIKSLEIEVEHLKKKE